MQALAGARGMPFRLAAAKGPDDGSWCPPVAAQTAQIRIGGSHIAPEDDVGLYGRSVTFIPESPSLPAPFR